MRSHTEMMELINNSPNVVEVTDIENGGIGFWTNLSPRKDDEEYEEYLERIGDESLIINGGLLFETLQLIEDSGYELTINDCEGLENEMMIYPK